MSLDKIDVRVSGPNALSREYERHDVRTGWKRRVANLLDDASSERFVSIFGAGFSEELPRTTTVYGRALDNNVGDAYLIRQQSV
jgi:hypothetical protein